MATWSLDHVQPECPKGENPDYLQDIKDAYKDLKGKPEINVDTFFERIVDVVDNFSKDYLNKDCVTGLGHGTLIRAKGFFNGSKKLNTNKVMCDKQSKLELYNELKHVLLWTNKLISQGRFSSMLGATKNYLLNYNLTSKNMFIYLLLYCYEDEDVLKNKQEQEKYQNVFFRQSITRYYIPDENFHEKYHWARKAEHFLILLRGKIITVVPNYKDYKDLFVEREKGETLELQKYNNGAFKYQIIRPVVKFLNGLVCYAETKEISKDNAKI